MTEVDNFGKKLESKLIFLNKNFLEKKTNGPLLSPKEEYLLEDGGNLTFALLFSFYIVSTKMTLGFIRDGKLCSLLKFKLYTYWEENLGWSQDIYFIIISF